MVKELYANRLAINLAGLKMKTPVTTASGTFGFGLEFTDFLDLEKVGAITVKGTSMAPRAGNQGQRAVETPAGMLNSVGLENPGSDYFLQETLPQLRQYDVPVIVNIDGSSPEEYGRLAAKLDVDGVAAVEINVSCPNVNDGGIIFGTDAKSLAKVVEQVKKHTSKIVITKLSPNVTSITEMAKAAEAAGTDVLSLINTLIGMKIDIQRQCPGQRNGRPQRSLHSPRSGTDGVSGGPGGKSSHYRYGRYYERRRCRGILFGRGQRHRRGNC